MTSRRLIACAVLLVSSAVFAQPAPPADDKARVEQITTLAKTDPAAATKQCVAMITGNKAVDRPLGVATLIGFADAKTLGKTAADLRVDQFKDERRLIVRALGQTDADESLKQLAVFIKDRDPLVRAAAALAVADHGKPASLALLMDRLPSMTDYWNVATGGDEGVYNQAVFGAIKELSGQRFASSADVRTWWQKNRASITASAEKPAPPAPNAAAPTNGRLTSAGFDFRFQPTNLDAAVAKKFGFTGAEGWSSFSGELEGFTADIQKTAAPLFGGTLHMPLTRVNFSNHQTYGGTGGVQDHPAVGGACQITFDLDAIANKRAFEQVARHEYVHVVQAAQFPTMPRWFAEGMAQSVDESPQSTVWWPGRVAAAQLNDLLNKGGVSAIVQWKNSGVTGNSEGPKYAMSHLVVDYLRFGDFSAADARLFCLMGELNRGRPEADIFKRIYGKSLAELDKGLSDWVATLKEPQAGAPFTPSPITQTPTTPGSREPTVSTPTPPPAGPGNRRPGTRPPAPAK